MEIFINDNAFICGDNLSLSEILDLHHISSANIAVAIDSCVIPKSQWGTVPVKEGSKIIIIKAVQGG